MRAEQGLGCSGATAGRIALAPPALPKCPRPPLRPGLRFPARPLPPAPGRARRPLAPPRPPDKPGTVPVGLTPPSPASPAAPGAITPVPQGVRAEACTRPLGGDDRRSARRASGAAGRGAPPPPPPPASAERSGHLGAGCNGAAFLGLTGLGEGGGRGLARSCGPRWPRKPPHHEGSAPALGLRL